ncbi:MAG: META domain-containing protein [Nitrospira sp.]|nr:META domain-containing protein [Nitrospira sp.]
MKLGILMAGCILLAACSKEQTAPQQGAQAQSAIPAAVPTTATAPASLVGTEWTLVEIGGKPVIANSKASLSFLEAGRAAGNASCNRFTGSVEIADEKIKFGPMASTRMACVAEDVNKQEMAYLDALAHADRFRVEDGVLLIYAGGSGSPLKFKRSEPAKSN